MNDINIKIENPKEDFIKFILSIESKFQIKNKNDFEDEILKLIRQGTKSITGLDIDEFENSFFEVIRKYSSLSLSDNIRKIEDELTSIKESENGS